MSENDQNPEDVQDKDDEKGEDIEVGADDDEGDDAGDDKGEEGKDKKPDPKKSKETSVEKVARLERQLKRARKESGLNDEPKPQTKSGEFGLAEKAYLKTEGIKTPEEVKLVKDFMKNTGKNLESALESKYFQAELKEFRENKASSDAIPKGKNRSSQSTVDTVEYWIAKGQLPPADQVELRRKVVNAKMAAAKSGNNFTSNPVIGG